MISATSVGSVGEFAFVDRSVDKASELLPETLLFQMTPKKDFIIDSSMSSSCNHPNHHVSAIKSWDEFISMDIFYCTVKLLTSSKRRRKGSEQSPRNPQL